MGAVAQLPRALARLALWASIMAMMCVANEQLQQIIEKLSDENFLDFVNQFCDDNCDSFGEDGEHKLEHTEIHTSYKRFFESRVESHLKAEGVAFDDFVLMCGQLEQMQDPTAIGLLDVLRCVDDYEQFVAIMRATKAA